MNEELEGLKERLKDQGIHVNDQWLSSCVQAGRGSGCDLFSFVFQQFLLSDIRLSGSLSPTTAQELEPLFQPLQERLTTSSISILRGKFVFQIDEIADISSSYDERWTPNNLAAANRLLKLRLSGGPDTKSNVYAIEIIKIPALSTTETKLGAKIALKNVGIRRGILQLEPSNAFVIGGFVSSLVESANSHLINVQKRKRPALPVDDPAEKRNKQPQIQIQIQSHPQLLIISQQQQPPQTNSVIIVGNSKPKLTQATIQQQTDSNSNVITNPINSNIQSISSSPVVPPPFLTLSQAIIKSHDENLKRAVVKAAAIGTVSGSFSFDQGRLSLSIKIDDGNTQIVADLSNSVIEQLIGVSAKEYSESSEEKQDISNKAMEEKLRQLEGMMTLEFPVEKLAAPLIVAVETPQLRECWAALQRVSKLIQQKSQQQ